ncbi:MAG TPA: nickel pincer cofactor biosynthesis protein LarB [Kiritimatiellia bacterium]|nr:nickel pincer cofactor biosynthesis protein LarB [Kiritimatiellia bacterium]HNR93386.1 nickel pincer cofactor biosynthesis protein LarB [Kiritimatiellia bacterium]HNS81414.1 nickel pincer cofactor biosynthesis protein LarB [Kiritimatiellia bacterium]HPA77200.1 nickel pincer cofactor biosynthesis protein LarB [Kiritimatiellia bacterium]HQQ04606.1 nickel pincer cofactor biosynthesis protein LarB [Kiritimatiellia bacterium]
MNLEQVLKKVAAGEIAVAEARRQIEGSLEQSLGFARIDMDRPRRCGHPETIYCPGKTVEQIVEIAGTLHGAGQHVMATRATEDVYRAVAAAHPAARWHADARAVTLDAGPLPEPRGLIAVVTAGTADLPVAEEACLTAERMGARIDRIYDVGVAGLHRLGARLERLRKANVVVVVAGMEGALPSVVGGLIDRPVIAVPTSVGYSLNLHGLSALLAMLNSCVPGITVVNVDNGFGAGVAAAMINRAGAL